MEIKKEMIDALNVQMNKEMFSAYLYMAMSADCKVKGWDGAARWFFAQAQEELAHARKFYEYILDRGERPVFDKMDKPQENWSSLKSAFEAALEHEKFISQSILDLLTVAKKLEDTPTEIFLQWYVTEQVEEEASVDEILVKFDQISDKGNGLYMLDKELGARE
jgi:ferritin